MLFDLDEHQTISSQIEILSSIKLKLKEVQQ
jgi:hypothetical protein